MEGRAARRSHLLAALVSVPVPRIHAIVITMAGELEEVAQRLQDVTVRDVDDQKVNLLRRVSSEHGRSFGVVVFLRHFG